MKTRFKIGDLVSAHLWRVAVAMPGVGEIVYIDMSFATPLYYCEHNGIIYHYTKDEIYLYDPY